MNGKESLERQNRIIRLRRLMEEGKITIPDFHAMLRDLGLNPHDDELEGRHEKLG